MSAAGGCLTPFYLPDNIFSTLNSLAGLFMRLLCVSPLECKFSEDRALHFLLTAASLRFGT